MEKKKKQTEKPEGFDSFEELYFSWYLAELKQAGVITLASYHPETMEICAKRESFWLKRLKTKVIHKPKVFMNNLEYTPDWLIYWNPVLIDKFIFYPGSQKTGFDRNPFEIIPFIVNMDRDGRFYSYIDVKGGYSGHGNKSNVIFSIMQKVVFQLKSEYIQSVDPYKLFRKTFAPQRFMVTNKKLDPRKAAEGMIGIREYFQKMEVPIQMQINFEEI